MFEFKKRLRKLKSFLREEGCGGMLVSSPANVYYLSGFQGEGRLLIGERDYLITDFRYKEEAACFRDSFSVRILKKRWEDAVERLVGDNVIKRLGFEPKAFSFRDWDSLKRRLPGVELVPLSDGVERFRRIKDKEEIGAIRSAIDLTAKTVERFKEIFRTGVSEREIASELEKFMRVNGAKRAAFDIIAASGKNSSKPHSAGTDRKIGPFDMVLLDIGAQSLSGYNCDLTRVFFGDKITSKQKSIYDIVQQAQARAISKVRAGVKIRDIDKQARDFIEKKGFGKFFGHSLGHGVGLEVHEQPFISKKSKEALEEGMVFTIEPGIYIPGWGGIRIEDMVLVTKSGCEVLTEKIK